MSASLRLVADPAVDALPAPTTPAESPRLAPDGRGRFALIALVPHFAGKTSESRERAARRYAEQQAEAGLAERVGGRWVVAAVAAAPFAGCAAGETLAAWAFRAGGVAPGELFGVRIGEKLRAAILAQGAAWRKRFLGMAALARELTEHEQRLASLPRDERDRLFRAEPERGERAAAAGLTRWSARAVRAWRATVERGEVPDLRGRPRRESGGDDARFSPEAVADFKRHYLDPRRRSVSLCWQLVAAVAEERGWAWPSLRVVRDWTRREFPAFISDFHRLGERRWAAKHAPRIERDYSSLRANEVWVADHGQLDLFAELGGKPVRPWLTALIDARSRLVTGWVIDTNPRTATILGAIARGVETHGSPELFHSDCGNDYDSAQLEQVLQRLGIRRVRAIPYHPMSKGAIERFLRTVHERFDTSFPSYLGGRTDARPEELHSRLRAGKVALPPLDTVRERFGEWLVAYHATPHSGDGMDGRTPAEVFVDNPIPKRTAPADVLAVLLVPAVECTVTRRGVTVGGVSYGRHAEALWRRRGERVLVRLDPKQGDRITVYDCDDRFICEALNDRLRGVTRDEIAQALREQARARRLAKRAAESRDMTRGVEDSALLVARQRRYAEQAARRKAAGAEGEAALAERPLALLPGAAELVVAAEARRLAAPSAQVPELDQWALMREASDFAEAERAATDAAERAAQRRQYELLAETADEAAAYMEGKREEAEERAWREREAAWRLFEEITLEPDAAPPASGALAESSEPRAAAEGGQVG